MIASRIAPRAAWMGIVLALSIQPVNATAATARFRGMSVEVDEADAFPGGMLTVRLVARRPIRGEVQAILDGRRCPAFWTRRGLRVLVPVPVTHPSGPATLGVEIRSGGGRRRFAIAITIAPRVYPPRETVLPDAKRERVAMPASVRDGRLLHQYLRTVSPRQEWRGAFQPPVDVPPAASFGSPQTYAGMAAVESRIDAIHGEYHRGLDYDVVPGTTVKAPAAGKVLFAGTLALAGSTVVVDHGHGLLSVFSHLAETGVRQGESLDTGRTIGTSGESGIAATPHLHWAVYLFGVAIDPRVTERL
jgi:murein DD-endopeptidase MepM/ murein hydrolase activator NlpD